MSGYNNTEGLFFIVRIQFEVEYFLFSWVLHNQKYFLTEKRIQGIIRKLFKELMSKKKDELNMKLDRITTALRHESSLDL